LFQLKNDKRKLVRLQKRVHDHQRILMLLSQNKIAGVSHLLATALQKGVSLEIIGMRLQLAISGSYSPHSGWSDREYDIAFLVKAIGGPRLLYAMQQAEGYPSLSTLRRRKPIPELVVSENHSNIADC
jgi:hypothetical protein